MSRKLVGLILMMLLLSACGGGEEIGSAAEPSLPASAPETILDTQLVEDTQPVESADEQPASLPAEPSDEQTSTQPAEQATEPSAEQSLAQPTDDQTVKPPPEQAPSSAADPLEGAIAYNLPPATLTTETGLYVSPNRDDLVVPVIVPAGETIYIMGRNATSSHLRAVWNTGVGWVPVSFTSYSGDRGALSKLPEFEQEPPRCAEPVTTQFNLGSIWTADQRTRVAVVVDLFRSRYGDFPESYLLLSVNGAPVESSRRAIVERGQFSLKDIVFSLPGYLQPGDTLGYRLETTTDESLAFMATIFRVPEGCVWDVE